MGTYFITVKRTGEQFPVWDGMDEEPPRERFVLPQRPQPPEPPQLPCELCGKLWAQYENAPVEPRPFICLGCVASATYRIRFHEVPYADHEFLGRATAALKALSNEVKNARRATVAR